MLEGFETTIRDRFRIEEYSKVNKVCDLREAIQKNVMPGMTLHLGMAGPRWSTAAIYELARQFWGTKPEFIVESLSANHPVCVLVRGGLIKKLNCAYFADPYYTLSPNTIFASAVLDGSLEIEHWSLYTHTLRLRAAALGVGFLPTRSLVGSSMAEGNKGSFLVMVDPFQSGQKLGLVKAVYPDLSIYHGWIADREGNTIFHPPIGEGLDGAYASRDGVLITVEKIVSTDYIRTHASLVQLPGHMVRNVCEVPFGAHPSGMYNRELTDFEGYAEDYEFVDRARQATRDIAKWDAWIDEWVLGCRDHQEYLRKLGTERILYLKGKARSDCWLYDTQALDAIQKTEMYSAVEMAIITSARKLNEIIQKKGYQTVLCGAGIPNLGAWLAWFELNKTGYPLQLMAEVGLYGYSPRPFEPYIFNHRNFPTCKLLTGVQTMLGVFTGGGTNKCIGALGAAEVDKHGNVNTTRIGSDRYLVGSGGANDVASAAQEVIVTAIHDRTRFVDRVSYITSPGWKVKTLISTLGVFEKLADDQEFTLTGYYPSPKFSTPDEHIRYIKENCSWDLKVCDHLHEIAPPTDAELKLLRIFDPYRYFLGKQA